MHKQTISQWVLYILRIIPNFSGQLQRNANNANSYRADAEFHVTLSVSNYSDPCTDNGHPCYGDVPCTKLTDTEFQCGVCPRGLRGDGRGYNGCLAVNECEEASPCFHGAECEDLLEGYRCGICPDGFLGEGMRGHDISDANILTQVS